MKKITSFLFAIMLLLLPVLSGTEVYIGTFSDNIVINEGDSLRVPIFFLGEELTGKPIELFIWKEGIGKEYFSSSDWKSFTDLSQMMPLLSINMVEYANITWEVYRTTTGTSFNLNICMDSFVDGRLTQEALCDIKRITVKSIPIPPPPPMCIPSSIVISPSPLVRTFPIGGNVPNTTISIKNNCTNNIPYRVTIINGSWITSPKAGDTGTGTFTVVLNTSSLPIGPYSGGITIDTMYGTKTIPILLSMVKVPSDMVLLKNLNIEYYSYDPGQVRYFTIYENSNRGLGNTKSLIVDMMDMAQTYLYNIDMIVKYAGVNGELGKPTMSDYNDIKAGKIKYSQNNFYFHLSSNAFETVEIPAPNPQGYYYVMVINIDTVRESKISIKYQDFDSY